MEHLRLICIELQMAPTHTGVLIQGSDFMAVWQQGKDIDELSYLKPNVKAMLDEVHWWASAMMAARAAATESISRVPHEDRPPTGDKPCPSAYRPC
jgi:hypothetical protein